MQIVGILNNPKPVLYAAKFDGESDHELEKSFDRWNDSEYLYNFFESQKGDLRSYNHFHNKSFSIEDAVRKTLSDGEKLEDVILDLAYAGVKDEYEVLQTFFRQLNDMETDLYPLQKSKGKLHYQSWLRIYAIRIDKHLYVISGGAIKLTKTMEERSHTQRELKKMDQVVNYLRRNNLINEAEFKRFELGL